MYIRFPYKPGDRYSFRIKPNNTSHQSESTAFPSPLPPQFKTRMYLKDIKRSIGTNILDSDAPNTHPFHR